MFRLRKLKTPWSREATPREFSSAELEKVVLGVLSDGTPRNIYWIKRDAEEQVGQPLPGTSINLLVTRLEDEGKLTSSFGQDTGAGVGRHYRLT
jgi:DNA-binding PadR family transcriptional regulator